MSASDERWQRNPAALWRRSLDGVVLLAPAADEPVVLRGGGPAVWDRLGAPITLDALVFKLSGAHGADEDEVGRDVRSLIDLLAALCMVSCVSPPGGMEPVWV